MIALEHIQELAREVGFDDAGAAVATRLNEEADRLSKWLQDGCHGSMQYMAENFEKRVNPEALVPGTHTVVVCVLSYFKHNPQPAGAPYIALSGLSERDYHEVVKEKLLHLEERLVACYGPEVVNASYQHLFCDSAPVLERAWAVRAGMGFIGRHRGLIHPRLGSFVHLGVLFLQEPLASPSHPLPYACPEHCRACLNACPTHAIRPDGMDARRCVSYLTIERKEPLPEEHQGKDYLNLYGCDACQMACPFNQHLTPDLHNELRANPLFARLTRNDWESMSRRQKTKLLRRLAK